MKRRAWIASTLTLSLLTGCATGPGWMTLEPGAHWSGRLALTVTEEPPQHFSALFELVGHPEAGEIRLTSPFGQLIGIARWSADEAELIRGHERQRYRSMDELTAALTGTALPLTPLFQWLRGQAVELQGWQADLSQLAEGRLSARRMQPQPAVQLRIVLQQP
jgi:outer membrane lipoprotein LolB